MRKIVTNYPTQTGQIWYLRATFLVVFSLLFINTIEAADIQTNCNLSATETILNYTIPINDADSLPIDNATVTLTVDGAITNVVMLNSSLTKLPSGTYSCAIGRNFSTGNYPTTYTISTDFGSRTDTGSFTVTYFDYDIALIAAILIVSSIFIYISLKSEDKVLNPLFFFLGLLLTIINFFIAAELSFSTQISAILTRIYGTMITLYAGGFILYVFLGYFMPFIMKAFGHKDRKHFNVEEDVD